MRSTPTRLWHALGRRGCFLLFLAVLDAVIGFSLLRPQPQALRSPTTQLVADIAPLWVWGGAWLAIGVVCLVSAWRSCDRVAYAAAIGIKVVWGAVYIGGWLVAGIDRGWLGGVVWLAFAAAVGLIASWPEPSSVGDRPVGG